MTALNGVIMSPITYSGASWSSTASRSRRSTLGSRWRAMHSTRSACWPTEKICAPRVWPFQRATLASPWAMSSISMSSAEGASRSSLRPDSMRCQARGTAVRRPALGAGIVFPPCAIEPISGSFTKGCHGPRMRATQYQPPQTMSWPANAGHPVSAVHPVSTAGARSALMPASVFPGPPAGGGDDPAEVRISKGCRGPRMRATQYPPAIQHPPHEQVRRSSLAPWSLGRPHARAMTPRRTRSPACAGDDTAEFAARLHAGDDTVARCGSGSTAQARALRMAVAGHEMVVDHAGRLHECIDDSRPDEFEAAAHEIGGHFSRQFGLGWDLRDRTEGILFRLALEEIPEQRREARALVHDLEIGARGKHRGFDLRAVAHDAGVRHQPCHLGRAVARDFLRVEAIEGAAEIFPLAQDRDPRQAGLEAVEHELLVERAVVEFRHAPFLVVIGDVERILHGPRAAGEAVRMLRRAHDHHGCAGASPGKAKRAQLGFSRRIGTPAARRLAPWASASSTRSRRSEASARPAAAD